MLSGATHYVTPDNPYAADPYTNKATAGTSILKVVEAALAAPPPRVVLISPGEYHEPDTIILTDDITVCGTNGRVSTVIIGESQARVFDITGGRGVIDSLTIRDGGGIAIGSVSGMLTNCLVVNNRKTKPSSSAGGGVYLSAAGTVTECSIISNACNCSGGGVYLSPGACLLNSYIIGNASIKNYSGGGVYNEGGVVSNCHLVDNYSKAGGGGIYVLGGGMLVDSRICSNRCGSGQGCGILCADAMVACCTIIYNINTDSADNGGGILGQGNAIIRNCTITDNRNRYGGGIGLTGPSNLVRNCLIISNSATSGGSGAGLYAAGTMATLDNCTIIRNTSGGYGGGVAACSKSSIIINNCIIFTNQSSPSDNTANWYKEKSATIVMNGSCSMPTNDLPGAGNITNWPNFVNFSNNNYRLASCSPCVNRGVNDSWMIESCDLDGLARIDKCSRAVDMGCYEHCCHGTLISVFLHR